MFTDFHSKFFLTVIIKYIGAENEEGCDGQSTRCLQAQRTDSSPAWEGRVVRKFWSTNASDGE